MFTPVNPHPAQPPTGKLKILAAMGFAFSAVLAIVVTVLSLQLITYHRKNNQNAALLSDAKTVLENKDTQISKLSRQLIAESMLPPLNSFNSQCPKGNEADGLFTPLSQTPIEGYNLFLVDCRSNVSLGNSVPRVIVFKTTNSGPAELVYASNNKEPLCISNKVPVANSLSAKVLLPVCQTN